MRLIALFLAGLMGLSAIGTGLGQAAKPAPAPEPGRAAAPPTPAEVNRSIFDQAQRAFTRGATAEALSAISTLIEREPTNARAFLLRGRIHEEGRKHAEAVADFTQVLKLEPRFSVVHQHLGFEHFKMGQVKESVADFDRFLEAMPAQAPHHWQRGIALYYAERYEDGRKQFELHQTVNPNDVENAAWHFLCVARASSPAKAREVLIPIQGDARIPMAQIHALFAGQGDAQGVMAAAEAGQPSPAELKNRLFYAHLYLGLYAEATGNNRAARDHLIKATGPYRQEHYMGDVARVHRKLREAAWVQEFGK